MNKFINASKQKLPMQLGANSCYVSTNSKEEALAAATSLHNFTLQEAKYIASGTYPCNQNSKEGRAYNVRICVPRMNGKRQLMDEACVSVVAKAKRCMRSISGILLLRRYRNERRCT